METRGTILLVENDAEIARLVRAVLGDAGYRVLVALGMVAARDILAAFRVRLVLTNAEAADLPAHAVAAPLPTPLDHDGLLALVASRLSVVALLAPLPAA